MLISPFPDLQVWPTSGLTFPWMEVTGDDGLLSTFDMQLGPDGCIVSMVMRINWSDLTDAFKQLLGYSYRTSGGPSIALLNRNLPWKHPYTNHLVVKNISSVKGLQLRGTQLIPIIASGFGKGDQLNTGPWSQYQYAQLTLHFWRPPYYLRSDADIVNPITGKAEEWLRFVDKNWRINTQMLSREGSAFVFDKRNLPNPPGSSQFPGAVAQKVTHMKVERTWYQIPEQGIFDTLTDKTPNGLPLNLVYMQTKTTNPCTGYVQDAATYPQQYPIQGCVNSPIGGGVTDYDGTDGVHQNNRFFGCRMGTLLLEAVEIRPRPLQLPPFLMQIPLLANNEAISQVQYDITFHFDLFDPPRSLNIVGNNGVVIDFSGNNIIGSHIQDSFRGHNLEPWSGDGLWYPVRSQLQAGNTTTPTTPIQYADFSDLFTLI